MSPLPLPKLEILASSVHGIPEALVTNWKERQQVTLTPGLLGTGRCYKPAFPQETELACQTEKENQERKPYQANCPVCCSLPAAPRIYLKKKSAQLNGRNSQFRVFFGHGSKGEHQASVRTEEVPIPDS